MGCTVPAYKYGLSRPFEVQAPAGKLQKPTQLVVLSTAARREDGAASVPERMNKAVAAKVGASLVVRRLDV